MIVGTCEILKHKVEDFLKKKQQSSETAFVFWQHVVEKNIKLWKRVYLNLN